MMQGKCLAQNKLDNISSVYITLTPTALLNYHQGIQGGIEMGINGFGYLEAEGTVFTDLIPDDSFGIKGHRFLLTYKLPLTSSNDIKLMLTAQYRDSKHDIEDDFERGGGAFFEQITFEQSRKMIGGTVGFSYSLEVRKIGQIEFGARIGAGAIEASIPSIPVDAVRLENGFDINERFIDGGNYKTPIAGISIKLKFNVF